MISLVNNPYMVLPLFAVAISVVTHVMVSVFRVLTKRI